MYAFVWSKNNQHAWEYVKKEERGEVELCEVPDTVAVTAALNAAFISHQSPLVSGGSQETTAYSAIYLSALPEGNPTTNLGFETYADRRESSTFMLLREEPLTPVQICWIFDDTFSKPGIAKFVICFFRARESVRHDNYSAWGMIS